jgi:hypothetical protein
MVARLGLLAALVAASTAVGATAASTETQAGPRLQVQQVSRVPASTVIRLGGISVRATCNMPCSLSAAGVLRVGSRAYRLRGSDPRRVAGTRTLLTKTDAGRARQLQADLTRFGNGTASIDVKATGAGGQTIKRMTVNVG